MLGDRGLRQQARKQVAHERERFLMLSGEAGFNRLRAIARDLRVDFPRAVFEVLNSGDRREAFFRDATDRQRVVDPRDETRAKTGWLGHALCSMPIAATWSAEPHSPTSW